MFDGIFPKEMNGFITKSAPAEMYKIIHHDDIHALTSDEGISQSKSFLFN
jgi:hypothetical protein